MLKKTRFFFALICCLALIAGCQPGEKANSKSQIQKSEEKTKSNSKSETYSLEAKKIEKEPAGKLFLKYLVEKEFSVANEYSKAEKTAVNEYVKAIKKENTKNWDADKWAKSLVTNFRTNYTKTLKPIRDFDVKYDKLKLPDGRLLQDVSEEEINKSAKKVNVALLLDSSGSMKSNVPGGNKIELAKSSLESFSKSMPSEMNISLYVFGHKGSGKDQDKSLSCGSVETVYPLNSYDKERFSNALNQFAANGWTPLAAAIQKANTDLIQASDENTKNFIYIVSDGIETCEGDPVQAAKDAKASNTDIQINIIGFDVDDEADRQLKEVAKAGGGEYTTAKDKQQLDKQITKSWKESFSKTTWRFWLAGNVNNINWDSLAMSRQLDSLYNKNITSRNREHQRMSLALTKILENDLIKTELKSEVSDLLFERHESISKHSDKLHLDKHNAIYNTADRLKGIIDQFTKDLEL